MRGAGYPRSSQVCWPVRFTGAVGVTAMGRPTSVGAVLFNPERGGPDRSGRSSLAVPLLPYSIIGPRSPAPDRNGGTGAECLGANTDAGGPQRGRRRARGHGLRAGAALPRRRSRVQRAGGSCCRAVRPRLPDVVEEKHWSRQVVRPGHHAAASRRSVGRARSRCAGGVFGGAKTPARPYTVIASVGAVTAALSAMGSARGLIGRTSRRRRAGAGRGGRGLSTGARADRVVPSVPALVRALVQAPVDFGVVNPAVCLLFRQGCTRNA